MSQVYIEMDVNESYDYDTKVDSFYRSTHDYQCAIIKEVVSFRQSQDETKLFSLYDILSGFNNGV